MAYTTWEMPGSRQKLKTERVASRVTPLCRVIIDRVMARLGISESAVLEIAMREYAERHGIPMDIRTPSGASVLAESRPEREG